MLSRASSDAGTRLRRAKSAASVCKRASVASSEAFGADVARREALVAATKAYQRAHGTSSSDQQLNRHKSNASSRSQGRHFPPRGSSLRHAQDTNSHNHRYRDSLDLNGGYAARPGSVRPLYQSRLIADTPMSNPSPYTYRVLNETSPVKDGRFIRKTRSMYISGSMDSTTSETYLPYQPLSPLSESCRGPGGRENVAPTKQSVPLKTGGQEDFQLQVVGDKYLQKLRKPRNAEQSSFVVASFKRRQDQVGDSAPSFTHEGQASMVTYSSAPPNPGGRTESSEQPRKSMDNQTWKSSSSFKQKIKRVFRKPPNPSVAMPIQQLEASRLHYGDYLVTTSSVAPNTDQSPRGYADHQTRSRTPSPRQVQLDSQSKLRVSSIGHSEAESNGTHSRVTSWGDSSITNTEILGTENRPLSIIPEVDRQNPPVEPPTRRGSLLARGPFAKPLHSCNQSAELVEPIPIHTNRLASALLRRIGDSNREDKVPAEGQDRRPSGESVSLREHHPRRSRTSSITSGLSRFTKLTIRTVLPEDDHRATEKPEEGGASGPSGGNSKDIEANGGMQVAESEVAKDTLPAIPARSSFFARRFSRVTNPRAEPPSPQQIATRVQKAQDRWKTPLDETHFHTTPARPEETQGNATERYSPQKSTKSRRNARYYSPRPGTPFNSRLNMNRASVISPSVYSRDTDGNSPIRINSTMSLCVPSREEAGTAVIITSHPVSTFALGGSKPKKGMHSTESSRDWQTWLSKEVAEKLENSSQEEIAISDPHAKPSGHRREHAQIIGDETMIEIAENLMPSSSPCRDNLSERPASREKEEQETQMDDSELKFNESTEQLSNPAQKVHRYTALKERAFSRMNERFPFIETGRKSSTQSLRSRYKKSPEAEAMSKSTNKENGNGSLLSLSCLGTSTREAEHNTENSRNLDVSQGKASKIRLMAAIGPDGRSATSLSRYSSTAEEIRQAKASATPSPVRSRFLRDNPGVYRPQSAVDLRGRHVRDSLNINRKPITGPALEGDTLRMILEGPYADSPSPSSSPRNKENSPRFNASDIDFATIEERRKLRLSRTPTGGHRMADIFLSARRRDGQGHREESESPVFL